MVMSVTQMTAVSRRAGGYNLRPRSYTHTAARLAWEVGRAAGKALRSASGSNSAPVANEKVGSLNDTVPLTSQRDVQEYYRKRGRKRLSRKARVKRAKRKKFARSVRAIVNKPLGLYQFVKANVGSFNWVANQAKAKGFLLGQCTNGGAGQSSLTEMTNQFFTNNASLKNTAYIQLQSMTCELSFYSAAANTMPCDLDIYTLECVRDVPLAQANTELQVYYDAREGLENTSAGVIPVSDAGAGVARVTTGAKSDDRGWTPFNASIANKYFRIVKKEKVLLIPGGTTHVQLHKRFKGTKRVSMERVNTQGYLKGITCAYLVQAFSLWNGTNQPPGTIYFNTEYTYSMKYQPNNEDTIQNLP